MLTDEDFFAVDVLLKQIEKNGIVDSEEKYRTFTNIKNSIMMIINGINTSNKIEDIQKCNEYYDKLEDAKMYAEEYEGLRMAAAILSQAENFTIGTNEYMKEYTSPEVIEIVKDKNKLAAHFEKYKKPSVQVKEVYDSFYD